MKTITIYELLGMVKDGKAPKKIKYKDKIYYYRKGYDFNYMYNSSNNSPMDNKKSLFVFSSCKLKDGRQYWDDNTAIDFLNDEVEIIEEKPTQEEILEALRRTAIKNTEIDYENGRYVTRFGNDFQKDLNEEINRLNTNKKEKKIPEKLDHLIGYDIQQFDNLKEYVEIATNDLFGKVNKIIDTLNQVIDYLKSKGDE